MEILTKIAIVQVLAIPISLVLAGLYILISRNK